MIGGLLAFNSNVPTYTCTFQLMMTSPRIVAIKLTLFSCHLSDLPDSFADIATDRGHTVVFSSFENVHAYQTVSVSYITLTYMP